MSWTIQLKENIVAAGFFFFYFFFVQDCAHAHRSRGNRRLVLDLKKKEKRNWILFLSLVPPQDSICWSVPEEERKKKPWNTESSFLQKI